MQVISPNNKEHIDSKALQSYYSTTKKTIQEYINSLNSYNRFKSMKHLSSQGTILDDRSKLIDLYEACLSQDAHLKATLETLFSQIIGERYALARQNEKGKYVVDHKETKKIQGTQFIKLIKGVVESQLFGFTAIEVLPEIDPINGKLKEINLLERRNILPYQRRIVKRQGSYEGWGFDDPKYSSHYILVDSGEIGLFSVTTPLILAKKFTFANYINFGHTYGQPIIHGKTDADNDSSRHRLANEISSAAQNKVIVTGKEDEIDIKAFTMSNSEKIYTSLIETVNKEVSNAILGSESMAGSTQSYVGATRAHQDIFRDRVEVYREYVENIMNEQIIPRLISMGYLSEGVEFKYSKKLEMSNSERIELYNFLTEKYEVTPEEIEKEFGVSVGRQINSSSSYSSLSLGDNEVERMSDEEYFKRYGRHRGAINFLKERGR